jgi:ABC-2 type transport system permease protein
MIKEIFLFELKCRISRPETYIYITIFFVISLLLASFGAISGAGSGGSVYENAPIVISKLFSQMSFLLVLVATAIMGTPIIRDFSNNTASMIYSTPVTPKTILMGRFMGSFVVILAITFAVFLGIVLGETMPWRDATRLAEFNLSTYIYPAVIILLPNVLVVSILFFITGALTRNILVVYTLGLLFLLLYILSGVLMSSVGNELVASIFDPFAISTLKISSSHMSIADKNTLQVCTSNYMLINRLIWTLIAFSGLIIALKHYKLSVVFDGKKRRKQAMSLNQTIQLNETYQPQVKSKFSNKVVMVMIYKSAVFHFRSIVKEKAFIGIMVAALVFLTINTMLIKDLYGLTVYPVTYKIVDSIYIFILFFVIIAVYYSGELIWRDRHLKFNQLMDSMPFSDSAGLLGKFLGINLVYVMMMAGLIIYGITFQIINGYYKFEIDQYIISIAGQIYLMVICYTVLSFFIQLLVNHKYLGYIITIVILIISDTLPVWGVDYSLLRFAQPDPGQFSDMNGYGHFISPFLWKSLYWISFTGILLVITILITIRGNEEGLKYRFKQIQFRFNRNLKVISIALISTLLLSGGIIIYNTLILNKYMNNADIENIRVNYEKTLRKYYHVPQPKITDVKLELELYPEERNFTVVGSYWLKNSTSEPIDSIYIQNPFFSEIKNTNISFSNNAILMKSYDELHYEIYELGKPMMPNDSIKMSFSYSFITQGFVDNNSNTDVVYNGSFINSNYMPAIGYNPKIELSTDHRRKKYELPLKSTDSNNDSIEISTSIYGNNVGFITFDIVIGTAEDQTAIAPGHLVNSWFENNRAYYHYKTKSPMVNYYSVLSADYSILRDKYHDVDLEIYYHIDHDYNINRMMQAMKNSLSYFSENFSSYQYNQLRIMEFPRYELFAQSFANTIPFSEGMGFILKVEDDDIDMPYYVTAHEVAHQWWGHQVVHANAAGAGFMDETLAQYSALMVIKQNYPPEQLQRILSYEMDKYFKGRSHEEAMELPLINCGDQGYIYYKKGALAMYALQDYIGEDLVNSALRKYINDWASSANKYPVSEDLITYFKDVTPDSLQYLLSDMFESITIYDIKADSLQYTQIKSGKFVVQIDIIANKYKADGMGRETNSRINDWIDIGFYFTDEYGEEKLFHRKKYLLDHNVKSFTITLDKEPVRGGVDPMHMLIDKDIDDNIIMAVQIN